MSRKDSLVLAIATGQESKEGGSFVKYIGIAPFKVIAVNPTLAELQKLYPERTFDTEPNYIVKREGQSDMIRVEFHVRTDAEHRESNGIDMFGRVSYLLGSEYRKNKDATKIQVINDYAETAWVSQEEYAAKTLPEYALKNQFVMPYRPAYIGEEDLINFIKIHLNLPNHKNYKEGVWTLKPASELPKSACSFSDAEIKQLLSGNMTIIKNALKSQPNNRTKFLVGIRTTDEGREYQELCARLPIRLGISDYTKIDSQLAEMKNGGAFANTNFGSFPFKFGEYTVEPTGSFSPAVTAPSANPFGGISADNPFGGPNPLA